jgi:Flp pilus assembly protein TadG
MSMSSQKQPGPAMASFKQWSNTARRKLRQTSRASAALFVSLALPPLLLLGGLAIDGTWTYGRYLLLQRTVQSSALAAGQMLTSYYTSGTSSTTAITTAAQTYATLNMPTAQYGTVVPASNVVVGNWNASTSTFTSLASSGGTSPDAVQVTGVSTTANGNPVSLFFGGMIRKPTVDLQTTAIASYGTAQTFNTIIINDLSQSFASEITNQQDADKAILNCVANSSGSASQFGITAITGHATIMQPLAKAGTTLTTITSLITSLLPCNGLLMPTCSGSNVAAGLYSAIQQFSGTAYQGSRNNVIIITDGVPNADPITYTRADGIYPTPTSTTPTCTTSCTDANLWTMAQNQAANAYAAGINISTIYYSGDTPTSQQSAYATALATLVKGTGVAMVAPSASKISATYAGFCATMSSALKMVH